MEDGEKATSTSGADRGRYGSARRISSNMSPPDSAPNERGPKHVVIKGSMARRAASGASSGEDVDRDELHGPTPSTVSASLRNAASFGDRLSLHFIHNPLSQVALVGLPDHIADAGGSPDLQLRPPLSTAEESLEYRYRKQILNLGDVLNMVVCALGQVDCGDRNRAVLPFEI